MTRRAACLYLVTLAWVVYGVRMNVPTYVGMPIAFILSLLATDSLRKS